MENIHLNQQEWEEVRDEIDRVEDEWLNRLD